jgi:hypothetical protein
MTKHVDVPIKDTLTEQELSSIRLFLKKARELHATHIVSGAESGISLNVATELGKPARFQVVLPSEEYLRSFYMAFRFFYLEKERSNFLKIANIIKRRTDNQYARQYVDWLRDMWSGALAAKTIRIELNKKQITPSFLMDLWFNAHYFHCDDKKEQELSNLIGLLTTDVCRFMLADAVYNASKAIFLLANALSRLES